MDTGDLAPDEFAAAVVAVTTAFGDPTRRDIYLYVRAASDGVKAAEIADHFSVHPNVARHHLEKLAAGGYLDVELAQRPRHRTDLLCSFTCSLDRAAHLYERNREVCLQALTKTAQ